MVDKITKALNKLNDKEQSEALAILEDIEHGNDGNYDKKKLKGYSNVYRIRKGKLRIIYQIGSSGDAQLLFITRRSDTTYNF